jgi:excisionase family DNA binding protein
MQINKNLMSRQSAADYLGVGMQTLAAWACNKRYQLPYVKIGRRVMYRQSDLDAFIARNLVGGEGLQ